MITKTERTRCFNEATIKTEWLLEAKKLLLINEEEMEEINVFFYYETTFSETKCNKEIFYIPIIWKESPKYETTLVPIFWINFSPTQKEEIMNHCRRNGHSISDQDFDHPKKEFKKFYYCCSFPN